MEEYEHERKCRGCPKIMVDPRLNQLFCSIKCKWRYHNRIAKGIRDKLKYINHILATNRKILERLFLYNPEGKHTKLFLKRAGFNFQYSTHRMQNGDGQLVYFCFEYGLDGNDEGFRIIKKINK